jgi:3-isopropylmalate/(R)-2-methylmalate dehydratase small subunit
MDKIRGRVRKFGDNIDTDTIAPGPSLLLPMEEMKKHAFSPIFPDFYRTVREGDILVAGNNFGCGSSREQATSVVKALGFRYVVCESMAKIFLRNCVGLGVYPILAKGSSRIFKEGDEIEIDMEQGQVRNVQTGEGVLFEPLSGTPLEILESGGILNVLKKRIYQEKEASGKE